MKALFKDEPLIFDLVPRIYPQGADVLVLKLRNEFTNELIQPIFSYISGQTLKIILTEQPTDFEVGNKYEIELLNENEVIYRGKLMILKSGTNTQNFEYGTQKEPFSY